MTKPRLASGPQLWRLNKEGRLMLVNEETVPAQPISATAAFIRVSELAAGDSQASEPFVLED